MTHRYRPQRLRNGAVVQSGIDAHDHRGRDSILSPRKAPYRAIVVNTHLLGEDAHVRGLSVECDVILVHVNIALHSVPVMQRQHGINNVHDLWIPRKTTRVLTKDSSDRTVTDTDRELNLDRILSRRGTDPKPITPLGDVDGDMVLVDFIEGNQDFPIIVGALPHERTRRPVRAGTGWREGDTSTRGEARADEYYTHHFGCEVRINEQGEFLIDTVDAYSDPATEDNSPAVGQVRVRLKDNLKFTVECDGTDVLEVFKDGTGVHVHLGEGATESLLKGDAFKTLYDAHTHSSPAGGSTGPPAVLLDVPPGTHLSTQHKVK